MRCENEMQSGMFSYFSPEQRVPSQHPLRAIKAHADDILAELSPVFDAIYSKMGRVQTGTKDTLLARESESELKRYLDGSRPSAVSGGHSSKEKTEPIFKPCLSEQRIICCE